MWFISDDDEGVHNLSECHVTSRAGAASCEPRKDRRPPLAALSVSSAHSVDAAEEDEGTEDSHAVSNVLPLGTSRG